MVLGLPADLREALCRLQNYSRYTNFSNRRSMAHFADAHWTDLKCTTPIGQILNLSNGRRRNVPCFMAMFQKFVHLLYKPYTVLLQKFTSLISNLGLGLGFRIWATVMLDQDMLEKVHGTVCM